jgi:hypothetical protein
VVNVATKQESVKDDFTRGNTLVKGPCACR